MNDELKYGERDSTPDGAVRRVQLFRAGSLQFGVLEAQVANVAEWREPTPLPHAPESVLGVVSIQGRMLTVLDLARLSGHETVADEPYREIISLRDDQQLALAATEVGESIDHSPSDSEAGTNANDRFVSRVFTYAGAEVRLLNVSELFAAALHGRERRRRRF